MSEETTVPDPSLGRPLPIPTGAPYAISTELAYAAFPYTVRTAAGTLLCSYKTAPTHNAHSGNLVHRRSLDGVTWGGPYQMPGQSAGFSWGHGGLAAETVEQGGRIYLLLLRLHFIPGTSTVDEVRCWAKWSDDDGLTWQLGDQFPVVTGTGWYPSSVIVCRNGDVLAAGYTPDGWARYYRSTDRGDNWTACGTAKPADRGVGEPTLVQLVDGRIVSFLRSDVPTQILMRTIHGEDLSTGTWATPIVASYDASGLPNATVVDETGNVAVLYRGYSDTTNPSLGRPMRVLMFTPDPGVSGLAGYRGNIDICPAITGLYLYGNLVETPAGWRAITGVEGPGGQAAGAAQVVTFPLEWRTLQ